MKKKNTVEVWVPHRISGFFQMQDPSKVPQPTSLLRVGSRGGGPALTAYGKTSIEIASPVSLKNEKESPQWRSLNHFHFQITINEQDCTHMAATSVSVLELMEKFIPENIFLRISHEFSLPLGAGFGSSGAGALGVALGISKLFDLSLSPLDVAQYAHIAEVFNHTGLGTVAGQFYGGLSIVCEPGYPFKVHKISIPLGIYVGVASWGPISTKQILTNPEYRQLIFQEGKKAMEKMRQDWSLKNYMQVCSQFLHDTDMLNKFHLPEIQELIKKLQAATEYGASLNQLGKSVFCVCTQDEIENVTNIFHAFSPSFGPIFLRIEDNGFLFQS